MESLDLHRLSCLQRACRLYGPVLLMVMIAGCSSAELKKADGYAKSGEWDQAVAAYREALKKDRLSPDIQARMDRAKEQAAIRHYADGRRALEEQRIPEAVRELKLAFGLDPSKPDYQVSMQDALRLKEARDQLHGAEKLKGLGRIEEALTAFERAAELDPGLAQALEGITDLTKQQRAAKMVGGTTQPITLRFQNAKLREVFEILARTAGVNVIFDKEVRDDPVTIFIKDLPFDEALSLILNTNGMVAQKVAADTLLVMPNNKQKQAQYQDLLMRTFYLSNAKAKDAVNLVRTLLDSKKIYVDEKINAIVVRDEPAKIQLAEKLLFAIDRREPEVELDLEVLEVNRTKSLKYGLNFAKAAGAGINPPNGSGGISTSPTTFKFQELTAIGTGSYLFSLPASVLIDFFKQDSDAKTLASPKLRVLNNKAASINIGDKQPILLSTTNVLPGQAATGAVPTTSTVTSIEFKDTGVKLTVEPSVNLTDEVTLKLKVEVTRLGDQVTLQASPEIKQFKFGTRMAETVLMLKDDETVVLAGLIQDEDRKTRSSVPILGDIPWIGQLFTSTTVDQVSTEVVLTITPRVVRSLSAPPIVQQAFWSGTDSLYATEQLFAPRVVPVSQTGLAPGASRGGEAGLAGRVPAQGTSAASSVLPQLEPGPPLLPTQAAGTPVGSTPVPTTATVPVDNARLAGGLYLTPADLSAGVGQEVRVDILTPQLTAFGGTVATLTFDPNQVEFRRVGPGLAAVAARATDGRVSLTLRPQGTGAAGEGVLAMLFFQVKGKGDIPLTLDAVREDGAPLPGGTGRALLHAR